MNNLLTLTTTNNYLLNNDREVINFNDELLEEYKNSMDLKKASKKTYLASIKLFLDWLNENNIDQVEYNTLLKYKEYLQSKYKANTTNTHIIAIKDLFKWLETKGFKNIAKYVKKVKTENVFSRDMLTLDQEKQILNSIDKTSLEGARAYALFKLMAVTGLREIEVINADIQDIRIRDTRPVLYIKGKGKDAKDNFVILPNGVLSAIQNYLKLRDAKPIDPLFTSTSNRNKNGRLTTMSIQRIIKGLYKANGIINSNITTHSLRHTCISNAIHKGANIEQVKAMARHSNINTTMIYYHNIDRLNTNSPEDLLDNEFINY